MTMNEIRKQYKADGKLYKAVGNIIETLKGMDEAEIRRIGLYFNISWRNFSKQAKFSKKRIDQKTFEAIVCGVLQLEHYEFKCYDSEKFDKDLDTITTISRMIYSYKHKGLIDIYRTGFGNRYVNGSFAVDLTV